jgi:hypothetical protein
LHIKRYILAFACPSKQMLPFIIANAWWNTHVYFSKDIFRGF